MTQRTAKLERKSKETEITAELTIEGKGAVNIKTQIGLLDHMLELFAFHGFFDLNLDVQKADLNIDGHHTNEDIGIVLGKIFKKALDEKQGIRRFGWAYAPMESTLGRSVIDISGRGYLELKIEGGEPGPGEDGYTLSSLEHFLESFAHQLGANLNVWVSNPSSSADLHTVMETIFKSLGMALDRATQVDNRRDGGIPSTKGIID